MHYSFPSFCDCLNGQIFFSGGLVDTKSLDPVSNAFLIESVNGDAK